MIDLVSLASQEEKEFNFGFTVKFIQGPFDHEELTWINYLSLLNFSQTSTFNISQTAYSGPFVDAQISARGFAETLGLGESTGFLIEPLISNLESANIQVNLPIGLQAI